MRWSDRELKKFITNVGLITSNGPYGQNVMACEWTHQISSNPGLIAIAVHPENATADNITRSKEFGVNICATDQNVLSSIAGNYSGKEHDKIKALQELGFEFYKANKIGALMIKGSVMNIECKVIREFRGGDHILFIGEVVDRHDNPEKEPLAYHKGKYWMLNMNVPKPSDEERKRFDEVVARYRKG